MALTDQYIDLLSLKSALGIPVDDTSEDARLTVLINTVSRSIDAHCHRRFYAATETRYYDSQRLQQSPARFDISSSYSRFWGSMERRLWLDWDLISLSEFLNGDGTPIPADQYILYPLNTPVKRWIDMRLDGRTVMQWQNTPQRAFALTGSWGFVTPESDAIIPAAALEWGLDMQFVTLNAGAQSVTIGSFSTSMPQAPRTQMHQGGIQQLTPPPSVTLKLEGFVFHDLASPVSP